MLLITWRSPFIQDLLSQDSSGSRSSRFVSQRFSQRFLKVKLKPSSRRSLSDHPQNNLRQSSRHHSRVEAEGRTGRHRESERRQTGSEHLLPVPNQTQQLSRGLRSFSASGEAPPTSYGCAENLKAITWRQMLHDTLTAHTTMVRSIFTRFFEVVVQEPGLTCKSSPSPLGPNTGQHNQKHAAPIRGQPLYGSCD